MIALVKRKYLSSSSEDSEGILEKHFLDMHRIKTAKKAETLEFRYHADTGEKGTMSHTNDDPFGPKITALASHGVYDIPNTLTRTLSVDSSLKGSLYKDAFNHHLAHTLPRTENTYEPKPRSPNCVSHQHSQDGPQQCNTGSAGFKEHKKGQSRDLFPLHKKLASQHTYATAARQSSKKKVNNDLPFYTVVNSKFLNNSKYEKSTLRPMLSTNDTTARSRRERRSILPPGAALLQKRLAAQQTETNKGKDGFPDIPAPLQISPFFTISVHRTDFETLRDFDDVSEISRTSVIGHRDQLRPAPIVFPFSKQHSASTSRALSRGRSRDCSVRIYHDLKDSKSSNDDGYAAYPKESVPRYKRSTSCPRSLSSKQYPHYDKIVKGKMPIHKRHALYLRLSNQDTIASSNMKSTPVKGKILSPFQKNLKAAANISSTKKVIRHNNDDVYDRLIRRGKRASLRKQMLVALSRNSAEHESFSAGCRSVLVRKSEGRSFVSY